MSFNPEFYDHEVVQRAPDDYVEMTLSPAKILNAWRMSIFAHELLNGDGTTKGVNDMHPDHMKKYIDISELMNRGEPLAKPVLGIGIMDNVEIGIGREIILVANDMGLEELPFHVRKSQADDIKSFF
jgi:hypothetical protein